MATPEPLTSEQQKVLELTRLAGLDIREDIFVILLDLIQQDTAPMLVLQVLRSLAGAAPETSPPATLLPSIAGSSSGYP